MAFVCTRHGHYDAMPVCPRCQGALERSHATLQAASLRDAVEHEAALERDGAFYEAKIAALKAEVAALKAEVARLTTQIDRPIEQDSRE